MDENNELPDDFLSEIYKWALECKYIFIKSIYTIELQHIIEKL